MEIKIGIIGGSGLYEMEDLEIHEELSLDTPFGKPSDLFIKGNLGGTEVYFLSRHSRGHYYIPSEINYRANIWGMKSLGVTHIISVSAVGSFRESLKPGHIVIVDQFVDRTRWRGNDTFFGNGVAAHIAFANPVCPILSKLLYISGKKLGLPIQLGGTYLNMEGPAFSTKAESLLYKSWGMDVIGMTNLVEAKLSREAGIHFSTIALVTDWDSWHDEINNIDAFSILEVLKKSVESAKRLIKEAVINFSHDEECECELSLARAVATDSQKMNPETREKLSLILKGFI